MIEKEISELRRQIRPNQCGITKLHGCYVNVDKEIIATFEQSAGLLTEDENTMYLNLLKKSLSGRPGRNLIDVEFATAQVASGEEHKLLMELRETKLESEDILHKFYQRIVDTLEMDTNYLILMAHNSYDVPFKSRDDERQPDASGEVFSYILCSICPVKQAKSGLGYDHEEKAFHTSAGDWLAAAPVQGFLFPAFDHRSTNIYNALYYTKTAEIDEALLDALFKVKPPMSAPEQKETFEDVLGALQEDCSMEVVQTVTDQFREWIAAHKEAKEPVPLMVSRQDIEGILEDCSVSEEHLEAFNEAFDTAFGDAQTVCPDNLIAPKAFEVKTPEVIIKTNGSSDLIHTRVIDGVKYIMIRAEGEVTVNGVSINI